MDEQPKSIWKKSWKDRSAILIWLVCFGITFFVMAIIGLVTNVPKHPPYPLAISILGAVVASVVLGVWLFIRWLCCWRNFKRFLFGLACFATLIALFYAEEDWRGKHDWEKFKREWEAKGEHFDFASVIPPAVPDNQNFAMTPIVYTSYGSMLTRGGKMIPYKDRDTNFVDQMNMNVTHSGDWSKTSGNGNWQIAKMSDLEAWQKTFRTLVATTNEFPIAPQPQKPAQDVLLALSKYNLVIEELRQASQLPYSRFPLEYDNENPAAIVLSHLADLKRCAQVLQLRALAELQNSESEKALADVKLSLRLADFIHTEPFLI